MSLNEHSNLLRELRQWALTCLQLPDSGDASLGVVSGDASFRCYYRLTLGDGTSFIVVHAPPEKEDNAAFARVQDLLLRAGIRVPALLNWDAPRGFLLQEDFGNQLLLPLLDSPASADRYYGNATELLLQLQAVTPAGASIPQYDSSRLTAEMQLFPQWFVAALLGCSLNADESAMIEQCFALLAESAVTQHQVMVHRDFHSRNIMVLADDSLGLIDFQDAVIGPATYDLVSLLRDCYIRWSDQHVTDWALRYRTAAVARGMPLPDEAAFLRQFDLMGLQRHLKVLGIFARLALRDGKSTYLADLPLVIAYTLDVAERYPELAAFVAWFREKLLPLAERHAWYRKSVR